MKRTALASLFALALAAGAAQAQAPRDGSAAALDGNVVGGGSATIVGGGDNTAILYSGTGAGSGGGLQAQAPRLARARNGYGGVPVDYLEPETASPGREAWLVGGGDNAEVVFDRRR